MSAENCPLKLIRDSDDSDREKFHYLELDIPLDPNDPDGLKVTNKYKKLIHTDAESVLEFIIAYDGIVEDLTIPEGVPRFRLFESLIYNNAAKSAWGNVRDLNPGNDQDILELCIDHWCLKFMTRDISLDTKEYLRMVKKPRQWTVAKMNDRLQTLNNLIEYMPAPLNGGVNTPKFTDDELKVALLNCGPKSWRQTMVRAAYRPANLTEQTQYFEGLRILESENTQENSNRGRSRRNNRDGNGTGRNNRNNNENNESNDRSNNRRGNGNGRRGNRRNDNDYDPNAICPIHGGHTVGECTLIRNERQRYQDRRNNGNSNSPGRRNNNNNNGGGRNNHRYNTRSNSRQTEDNNNINENPESDVEAEEREMNNIYEEMNALDALELNAISSSDPQPNPISSDTRYTNIVVNLQFDKG